MHVDDRGAELLFQVITERDERALIAIASNAPFSEWGRSFTDPRLAAAVVDRVTYQTSHHRDRQRQLPAPLLAPPRRSESPSPDQGPLRRG